MGEAGQASWWKETQKKTKYGKVRYVVMLGGGICTGGREQRDRYGQEEARRGKEEEDDDDPNKASW